MDTTEILNRLNVIQVDVSCPSGAVSKTTVDRNGNEVFTDGSVRYMDRKLLRPFTAARQAAIRLCRDHGTRFLGGWAIPDESFPSVLAGLEAIAVDFRTERSKLAADLASHRLRWESEHPEVMEYHEKFPSNQEVLDGIAIGAAAYKIDPQSVGGLDNTVVNSIVGFAGKVLSEVAQEARDAYSPDATKASGRAKNVLLRIVAKLDSLAFVDSSLASVSSFILETLGTLPDGPLRGRDFAVYTGLMKTLMEPATVVSVASNMSQTDVADTWAAMAPATETPAADIAADIAASVAADEKRNLLGADTTFFIPPPASTPPIATAANWQW